jgi:TRAP-type C4-dicarboxylate transport system permease small subunit
MVRFILGLGVVLGGLLIAALVLLVASEVVLRSAFDVSLLVADEYSGYIVVALVFLGIPYALFHDALLRVDFLFERLKGKRREALSLLFDLCCLAVTAVLGLYLTRMVIASYERGTFSSTPAMTPLWFPQLVMPIGLALTALILLSRIAGRVRVLRGAAPLPPPRHADHSAT